MLLNAVHGADSGSIVNADDCGRNMIGQHELFHPLITCLIIISAEGLIIFRITRKLVSGQNLLITPSLFIGGGNAVPAAEQGNILVPESKQMIHDKIHCFNGINAHLITGGAVQLTGEDHGNGIADLVYLFHKRLVGMEIVGTTADQYNGVHALLLHQSELRLLDLLLTKRIFEQERIARLPRSLFTGDKKIRIISVSHICHNDADDLSARLRKSPCQSVRTKVVF